MNPYASYDLLGSITVLLVIPCFHLTLSNFTRPRCKSQRAALPAMIDVHPSQRYHSREIVICKQGEIYWQSNPSGKKNTNRCFCWSGAQKKMHWQWEPKPPAAQVSFLYLTSRPAEGHIAKVSLRGTMTHEAPRILNEGYRIKQQSKNLKHQLLTVGLQLQMLKWSKNIWYIREFENTGENVRNSFALGWFRPRCRESPWCSQCQWEAILMENPSMLVNREPSMPSRKFDLHKTNLAIWGSHRSWTCARILRQCWVV